MKVHFSSLRRKDIGGEILSNQNIERFRNKYEETNMKRSALRGDEKCVL